MKQQTAVEWLIEKLDQNFDYVADTLIEQAKEMEKQQIIDAWIVTENELQRMAAEQYYNETFNQNKL